MKKLLLSVCCAIFISTAAMAKDAKMEILGTYNDWTAYTYADPEGKVCYMASTPEKSVGKYAKRDDVFLIVTHRMGDKTFNVVNTVAGYTYKKGSKPTVKVDEKPAVSLVSHADTAWSKDNATDVKIIGLMKDGDKAVLKGESTRGTDTTDTFSLKGFSKAYAEIGKACGVKATE